MAGPSEPGGALTPEQRRRLDAVFGDVLPDTTGDERDAESPDRDPDADLLADRPPHHDRGA